MIKMEATTTNPDSPIPEVNNPILYNNFRVYKEGRIERKFKKSGWREIPHSANNNGYNMLRFPKKLTLRHRIVMAAYNENFDINNTTHLIDHIDHNKLNNSFDNLRVVTPQGNQFNRRDVLGYSWSKEKGKWKSQIQIDKKNKFLGYFKTEEEARAAYLAAKEKHHVIQELC
jgi:hypothetical protein